MADHKRKHKACRAGIGGCIVVIPLSAYMFWQSRPGLLESDLQLWYVDDTNVGLSLMCPTESFEIRCCAYSVYKLQYLCGQVI